MLCIAGRNMQAEFTLPENVDARAFASPKGLRPRRRGKPGHDGVSDENGALMRPGLAAAEREIVGIGDRAADRILGLDHLVGDAFALAISDRLFLGFEA
ncbi:hypothetical protein SAMN05192541_109314 [Bradyrhizobium arachidis]|nr:hypothetical protein SAMN05192541_109314 [Bradyrhizobium arachidis]